MDYEIFEPGNVVLQGGATIRNCKLAYKTYGKLNPAKDNVIVYPTWYSGQHYDNEWLIGDGSKRGKSPGTQVQHTLGIRTVGTEFRHFLAFTYGTM